MKVGDYVRTVGGLIGKVIEKKDNAITYFMPNRQEDDVIDVIKSSPNIKVLIEVGDYVNGYKVIYIGNDEIQLTTGIFDLKKIIIKSIVTKEQFSSMEYKVGK